MARTTLSARMDALETTLERLVSALETAPAKAAPAKAKAESPFVTEFLRPHAAAKLACEIHSAKLCNRKFSPKSSGRTQHVARIV